MKKDDTNIRITISEGDRDSIKLSEDERKHLEDKLKVLMDKWKKLDLERAKVWRDSSLSEKDYLVLKPMVIANLEKEIAGISVQLGIKPPFERLKPCDGIESGMQQRVNVSNSNGVSIVQTGNISGSDVFISGGDVIRNRRQ